MNNQINSKNHECLSGVMIYSTWDDSLDKLYIMLYIENMTNLIAISDARANLPSLVEKASKYLERFFITVNGQPKVAVLSLDELESLEETAELMAMKGAKESIKKGMIQAKKGKGRPLSEFI